MTREAFKSLFDEHFDSVRNYIYYRCGDAELATDIAQDTFMRVWEKQLDIIPGNTVGLFYKIAHDMFISRYRKATLDIKFKNSLELEHDKITPEDQMTYNELTSKYEQALSDLSEKQRVVFLMSRSEGLKYNEIAQRLHLSVKAVEKRMSKALAYFKEKLITENL